ncbi:MAG: 30S ribosomal protein S16 [Dehalococcoidia bacterium]|nr:30S ribosomal protein S16 [Dehalococcoidia bacterium]
MIRIRLARVGKKKQPSYRLVVARQESPRDGRFIEILGHYNPLKDPAELVFNAEKTRDWISRGAQPSEAAAKLLAREGIGEAPKRPTSKAVSKKAAATAVPAAPAGEEPTTAAVEETAGDEAPDDASSS